MKIRNMAVTKHHDRQTLELHVEIEGRRLFSVHIPVPQDHDDLREILGDAGARLRNLIDDELKNVSK